MHFNTAISALMQLLNLLEEKGGCTKESGKTIALLLAPLAPHLAEELWSELGGKGFVIEQSWPTYNPTLLVESTMIIAVQVNGKRRDEIEVPAEADEAAIREAALASARVQHHLAGRAPRKVIVVPGRLVNVVG